MRSGNVAPQRNRSAKRIQMNSNTSSDPRFEAFLFLQAQNGGMFLGQLPNPVTGEKTVNQRAARSVIDSLEMLESKTQGNLTANEERLLQTALRHLRDLYQQTFPTSESA